MNFEFFKYETLTGSLDSITNELNDITKYSSNIKCFSKIAGIDQFNRPVISMIIKVCFHSIAGMEIYLINRNNSNDKKSNGLIK